MNNFLFFSYSQSINIAQNFVARRRDVPTLKIKFLQPLKFDFLLFLVKKHSFLMIWIFFILLFQWRGFILHLYVVSAVSATINVVNSYDYLNVELAKTWLLSLSLFKCPNKLHAIDRLFSFLIHILVIWWKFYNFFAEPKLQMQLLVLECSRWSSFLYFSFISSFCLK